jgi:hypothetical protein
MNIIKLFSVQGLTLIVVSFFLLGCGEKSKGPEPLGALKEYVDPTTSFKVQYPQNWKEIQKESGRRFMAFPGKDASDAFRKVYAMPGEVNNSAAQIAVFLQPLRGRILDSVVLDNMTDMINDSLYTEKRRTTIAGLPAYRLRYRYNLADGLYEGEKYIVVKDTAYATVLEFSAFTDSYSFYKPTFDNIAKNFIPASNPIVKKQDTLIQNAEAAPPSPTSRIVNGTGFAISIPDNFNGVRTQNSGTIYSVSFQGDRLDCTIQVDVIDASKQKNLAKIVEDNKKAYGAASASKTTLGGVEAYYMNYSFGGNVQSRVYFAIKGDKMFRVTMNYFIPKQDVYKPVFEKSISTFRMM